MAEIDSPLLAYRALVEESVALKSFLADRVAALQDLRREDDHGGEQLRAEVSAYERAMDRAGKFLADWVRLDMDERLLRVSVRLAEEQAALLERVVEAVLADPGVGMTDDQREAARGAFGRHLAIVRAS